MGYPSYRPLTYHEYREILLPQGASGTVIHRAYMNHCKAIRALIALMNGI